MSEDDENSDKDDWKNKPALKVVLPVKILYCRELDYRTYRLKEKLKKFDSKVSRQISRMARRMEVQLKSHMFEPTDHITILSFLPTFQECDENLIQEGAAMWLFQYFVQKTKK